MDENIEKVVSKTDKVKLPDIVESPADSLNAQVYNAWSKYKVYSV